MTTHKNWLFLAFIPALFSCLDQSSRKLPILGKKKYDIKIVEGKKIVDTTYHRIKPFSFLNQDSIKINQDDLKDKIYVANFIFTTCPEICPIMTTNMLTVYNRYKDSIDFKILSHTIDPYNDSIPALKEYATNLGLIDNQATWHFLYGEQEDVFLLAKDSYFVHAAKEKSGSKSIVHNGSFTLIDRKGRIRGIYDGTTKENTEKLIEDIPLLFRE